MKNHKIIIILNLILVMFFCFMSKTEYATEISIKVGDINGDGTIDSRDTLRILDHIASSTIPQIKQKHPDWILTGEKLRCADINQDGLVDSRDTLRELEYIAATTIPTIRQKHPEWKKYIEDKWTVEVTGIKLNQTNLTMEKGKVTKLIATISPTNANNKVVTWSSSNTKVATVDGIGSVEAKSEGITIITAKTTNGKTATCKITVNLSNTKQAEVSSEVRIISAAASSAVTSVKLKQIDCTIAVNTNLQLNAIVQPTNAINKTLTWSSSDNSIAKVDKNGVVKGIKPGKVTITVKTSNNKKATCIIRVNIPAKSISLNKTSLTINKGSTQNLTVNFNPTNTTSKVITWKSSNNNIATVNTKGTVTAKSKGIAIITATSKYGKTATCKVIVNEKIQNIAFNTIAYSYVIHDKKVSTDDNYTLINTAEHFNYCGQKSYYTSLKCDIRPTKDGGLILCHDAGFTLDNNKRIINYNPKSKNTVLIHNLTTKQCLALQHKSTFDGKVCKVTDLETFLKICKKYNKYPFITVRDEYIDVIVPKVLNLLEKYDLKDKSIINSFTYNTLKAFRNKDKNIMLSYVISSYDSKIGFKKAHVDDADKLKNCIVSIFIFNGYLTREDSFKRINQFSSVIKYAKSKNVKVYAGTDSIDDRNKLYQYGISGCQFKAKINN